MPQTVAILLVVQVALGGIALFVLVDGPELVREHIRVIALWTLLVGGIAGLSLTIPWALTEGAVTAWGFVGLTGAACLCAVFIIARDFWKRHSRRTTRPRYPNDRAEHEWLLFDGQVERGPFSTAELSERFLNGEIAPSDYVWKPGIGQMETRLCRRLAKARRAAGGHTVEQRAEPSSRSPKRLSPFNRRCATLDGAIMDATRTRAHALSRDLSGAASDG